MKRIFFLLVTVFSLLGGPALAQCVYDNKCDGDLNRDGAVTVDEVITSLNTALNGCTACVDISGTWGFRYLVLDGNLCGLPQHLPEDKLDEVVLDQRDDCSFDGTYTDGELGDVTILGGDVSNQVVSFTRDLPQRAQQYRGTILSDGTFMSGTFTTQGGCELSWSAERNCMDITGDWSFSWNRGVNSCGKAQESGTGVFRFSQGGDCRFDGVLEIGSPGVDTFVDGAVLGRRVQFERSVAGRTEQFEATLLSSGDQMAGSFTSNGCAENSWTATRIEGDAGQ